MDAENDFVGNLKQMNVQQVNVDRKLNMSENAI
jgi:hypothetical protein